MIDAPIHSVAFAPSGRVAALGADVWLGEPSSLKKLPAPGPDLANVRVYFGRDDQPRLMGFEGQESVYYRWRGGRWPGASSRSVALRFQSVSDAVPPLSVLRSLTRTSPT